MASTDGCVFLRESSNTLNFHKLLKSRSNERFKESVKLHPHKTGPVFRSKFKTFKEEEDEFSATLRKAESLDHNNCIWLSSGGLSSPSSCFQDNSLQGYTDLKIDAWFISLLSKKSNEIISTKVTFFDGSRVNPIEEASLVLDQRKLLEESFVFHENLEENEVVSWLANESSSISSITDTSDNYSSSSSSSSSSCYSSEVVDLDEIGTDKPLFWPSEWTSEWDSDAKLNLFMMSPRKDLYGFGKSPRTSPDTVRLRGLNGKLGSEKGCGRRLEFGDPTEVKPLTMKSVRKHKVVLEDLLLVDKLNVEGAIEEVLGLDEFDGHYGVESEFNQEEFSLVEIF